MCEMQKKIHRCGFYIIVGAGKSVAPYDQEIQVNDTAKSQLHGSNDGEVKHVRKGMLTSNDNSVTRQKETSEESKRKQEVVAPKANLLLGVGSLLLLLLNAGFDLASGTVGTTGLAEGLVSVEALLLGGDSTGLLGLDSLGQRNGGLNLANSLDVG